MSDRNGGASTTEWRDDGALLDAYAAVGNLFTGVGTHRDPLQRSEVNLAPHILSEHELEALYRSSRICEKAICLLPEAAGAGWVDWEMGESDVEASDIDDYVKRIKARKGFVTSGLVGRLYGDGYLLLGIDDGQQWDLPVNEDGIRSIQWTATLTKCEIRPDWSSGYADYEDPDFYRFYIGNRKIAADLERSQLPTRIHKSRVLRFPGKRLYSELLQYTSGENDSILQAMFNAFNAWSLSMGASAAMMQDYSLFIYKLQGFAKLIQAGDRDTLMKRFTTIQMGKSILKGLMLDAENEDASFIQRNYSGVKDILQEQKDVLIAETGMPASKLFGSPQGSAFSESGLSDRYEWAACVESYEDSFWRENLEILQRYILLAKDGPTGGALPDDYGFSFRSVLQLTRQEEADLKFKHAQADGLLIRNKILHPKEVRQSRFGGAKYGDNITLDPDVEEELFAPEPEPVAPQQQDPPVAPPSDRPATNQDGVDLQQLRADAALGLIPRAVYLQAAGYRTDEIESGLRDELKQDAQAIAPNPLDAEAYYTDECLRDERGRFAGGNCGGGGKGGGGGGRGGGSLKERLGKLKQFAINKAKEQSTDLIVNTGGLVGSVIGQHFFGSGGALTGDLIGALATRQVVAVTQATLTARQRLRHDADYQVASRINQLRQLGRATLSEFNSPSFQRQLGNDLTGDLTGWAIGNGAAIAGNQIPGVNRIPFKGAVVAMGTVPRIQAARTAIIERTEGG